MKVSEVLADKGAKVVTVDPQATLRTALTRICEERVGALPVIDNAGALRGIVTERDILRQVYQNVDLDNAAVGDVMTRTVKVCSTDADVEEVEFAMTEGRFRHMPIMAGDQMIGMVSIGDMVKANLHKTKRHVEHLMDYIAGPIPE